MVQKTSIKGLDEVSSGWKECKYNIPSNAATSNYILVEVRNIVIRLLFVIFSFASISLCFGRSSIIRDITNVID